MDYIFMLNVETMDSVSVLHVFRKSLIPNFFYFFPDLSYQPKVRESLDNTSQLRGYISVTILELVGFQYNRN